MRGRYPTSGPFSWHVQDFPVPTSVQYISNKQRHKAEPRKSKLNIYFFDFLHLTYLLCFITLNLYLQRFFFHYLLFS